MLYLDIIIIEMMYNYVYNSKFNLDGWYHCINNWIEDAYCLIHGIYYYVQQLSIHSKEDVDSIKYNI